MHIGLLLDERGLTFPEFVHAVRDAADLGLRAAWAGHHYDWDPLTALAVAGREVRGIELGTAIVPSHPIHPLALASQALTASAALGNGRLTLGIGTSHRPIIEGSFGHAFDRPARHMREYLEALGPLLRGAAVDHRGATLTAQGTVDAPGAPTPSLLLAALGPAMLRLAGGFTDGTVTMWAGPAALDAHVVPAVTRAAEAAGRPRPRVVVGVFATVSADPASARERFASDFAVAGELPSYRATMDRGGAASPGELLIAGDEAAVERAFAQHFEAGATELAVSIVGTPEEQARTRALLGALATR